MNKVMRWILAMLASVALLAPMAGAVQAAEKYQPFILAYKGPGDVKEKIEDVKDSLAGAGFEIVGEYEPYDNAHIIIFTSDALKKVAAKSEYGGFAAPQRVAVTKVGDELQVTYVNPVYMAYAYRLKSDLSNTAEALEKALGKVEEFGTRKGMSARKLKKYHYTFGMEYFPDVYELAEYGSYEEAVKAVEKNLKSNSAGVRQLYRIDIPGKQETVFGVSMRAPEDGDKYMDDAFQMSVVDFGPLKGTPYLPYEIMVTGNRVVALHMRFRMAVYFPDLKMMGDNSFMKLMPSPEAVRKALTAAVGGKTS